MVGESFGNAVYYALGVTGLGRVSLGILCDGRVFFNWYKFIASEIKTHAREGTFSLSELEELLDQHDYKSPQVGDIRQGIILSISPQGIIVDLNLKRDGLVPPSDLSKLDPEERDALQINDELFVYILNTDKPDSLVLSINLARLNQDWIKAEEMLESSEMIEVEVIGYNKGGAIVPGVQLCADALFERKCLATIHDFCPLHDHIRCV